MMKILKPPNWRLYLTRAPSVVTLKIPQSGAIIAAQVKRRSVRRKTKERQK